MEMMPWTNRAPQRQSKPATKNTGQTRWVKWYSHHMTSG